MSPDHKKLVRATISKLESDEVKAKLLKVFGTSEGSIHDNVVDDTKIKIEDLNIAEEDIEEEDVLYGRYYPGNFRGNRSQPRYARGGFSNGRGYRGQYKSQAEHHNRNSFRGKPNHGYQEKRGNRPRCYGCGSIYHQAAECPEKAYYCNEEEEETYDIVLYQSNLVTAAEFNVFVAESSTSAILDCGASATVAGKEWFESYFDGLTEEQQQLVEYVESNSVFKFGSGQKFTSLYRAKIPAEIGSESIFISTDVVDTTIPLLLSKEAMKLAGTEINFVNDKVKMFGKEQNVHLTKSGHYAIPLNNFKVLLKDIHEKPSVKVVLVSKDEKEDKKKMAIKLHA